MTLAERLTDLLSRLIETLGRPGLDEDAVHLYYDYYDHEYRHVVTPREQPWD